ncbi:MAG: KH domain-containing protein [Xenococcus sp. (in: cyanobacteria)]
MPRESALSARQNNPDPDYVGLVSFLLEPFLEDPKTLSIHCEQVASTKKLWLRVAFDDNDKGKVFGRGGRNIQAIRTVIKTAATNVNQSIYLDIYGNEDFSSNEKSFRKGDGNRGRRDLRKQTFRDRRNNFDEGTDEFDRNHQGRRRKSSRERPTKPIKPLSN